MRRSGYRLSRVTSFMFSSATPSECLHGTGHDRPLPRPHVLTIRDNLPNSLDII